MTPQWRTAEWTFLRFHEGAGRPHPCYTKGSMEPWVEKLASAWGPGADIYVFFNNDPRACALRDAIVFAELCEQAGLSPTRVPPKSDVTIGGAESSAWATS